jgi:hypothetical protein
MTRRTLATALLLTLGACDAAEPDTLQLDASDFTKGGGLGKADASVEAVVVDFEFDGQVVAGSSFGAAQKIEDQLLYMVGHLNGDNSVARLDKLELTDVDFVVEGNKVRISYHAVLPVAWGDKDDVPTSYALTLPADISSTGQDAFTAKYKTKCVDSGAHDVGVGNMFYYYRPNRSGCSIAAADAVRTTAIVSVSDVNTSGKYPEYHKVWEDDVLRVVAVFGKYEDGATSNSDAGISAYNKFSRAIKSELGQFGVQSQPQTVPTNPGVAMPDLTFRATLEGGKSVEVVALLVDNVRTAGAAFDDRYAKLSTRADFIVYNGHAGLGANIRALATKGEWTAGQYAIVFMNGCDTYAYIDSALFDAHAEVNPGDPEGTQHLDIMVNAMPSFFSEMTNGTMAVMRGLLRHDDPMTYEQIFMNIDSDEVVLVTGEHDNVFTPDLQGNGGGEPGEAEWQGFEHDGDVARDQEVRFATPRLAPGRYEFAMDGTNDADLYVRTGAEPTVDTWECRPFKTGSRETCVVELAAPAAIHVMVRGWATKSHFELVGSEM